MSAPQLFADRFLVAEKSVPIDLATGDPVLLRLARECDGAIGSDWIDRCGRLARVAHPWMAECLDFGHLGAGVSFEAYRKVPPALAVPSPVATLRAVRAFLGACAVDVGLECHAAGPSHIVIPSARATPVVIPADALAPRPPGRRLVLGSRQRVLEAITERLRDEPLPGLAWCDVAVAHGAGGRTFLRWLAREARLTGWIPLAGSLVASCARDSAQRSLLGGRHLLVLYDGRHDTRLARDAACAAAAHIVFLTTGPSMIVRLVPACSVADLRLPSFTRAERKQARIRGIPERGVRLTARTTRRHSWNWRLNTTRRSRTTHVREAHATFTASRPLRLIPPRPLVPIARRKDDLTLVKTMVGAELARGRHAAAERLLRRGAAAAARREDPRAAGVLWLSLGRLLVSRGRPAAATPAIESAAEWLLRAGDAAGTVECAVLLGESALATLHADAAAGAFRTAVTTADASGIEGLSRVAAVTAAQGLWWLGRYDEARRLLYRAHGLSGVPFGSDALAARAHGVAASLALAAGETDTAVRHVSDAEAIAAFDPTARAVSSLARVRWLATIGDESALSTAAHDSAALARGTRDRPMAIDIRLLRAEGALRARGSPAARAAARGFDHLACRLVPPLIAARARLVLLALTRPDAALRFRDGLVARGFGAFATADAAGLALPPPTPLPRSPMLDDVVEMFRVCQEEEPRAALVKVAELLRVRCSAAVVAIVTGGAAPATIAVPAFPRPGVVAVRRALDAGSVIELHKSDAATEAAVPVLSAGTVVGAVGCRWINQPPPDAGEVRRLLQVAATAAAPCARALHELPPAPSVAPEVRTLVGGSHAMEVVRRAVAQAADAPFAVLIEAESGCGKELAARAIHRTSARKGRPFCVVNGAALPDELLEAELFGHARGAFTGAIVERRGMFEEADGGVLFLDEVGELSARAQAKLLRVLQDGEVRRVGETHVRRVDVRLVTATNRTLETEVQAGRFRRDLFYRLAVIRVRIPPLRDRLDDVPALAAAMWIEVAGRVGSRAVLAAGTLAALARYDWPGNVRELQNVLAALAVSAPRRGVIGPSALPAAIAHAAEAPAVVTLDEARRHFEARFVRAALARAGGHRGRAAADLGITRQGLAKLIDRLSLGVEEPNG